MGKRRAVQKLTKSGSPYREGYEVGYNKGWRDAIAHITAIQDEFLFPYFNWKRKANGIIQYLDGIMTAQTSNELAREALQDAREELGKLLDKIDELNRRAQVRFGFDLIDPTPAIRYREEIMRFITGQERSGDGLRALAGVYSDTKENLNAIRLDYQQQPEKATTLIEDLIRELDPARTMDAGPLGSKIIEFLQQKTSKSQTEIEALATLEESTDLAVYIRNRRRRSKKRNLAVTDHPVTADRHDIL